MNCFTVRTIPVHKKFMKLAPICLNSTYDCHKAELYLVALVLRNGFLVPCEDVSNRIAYGREGLVAAGQVSFENIVLEAPPEGENCHRLFQLMYYVHSSNGLQVHHSNFLIRFQVSILKEAYWHYCRARKVQVNKSLICIHRDCHKATVLISKLIWLLHRKRIKCSLANNLFWMNSISWLERPELVLLQASWLLLHLLLPSLTEVVVVQQQLWVVSFRKCAIDVQTKASTM